MNGLVFSWKMLYLNVNKNLNLKYFDRNHPGNCVDEGMSLALNSAKPEAQNVSPISKPSSSRSSTYRSSVTALKQ